MTKPSPQTRARYRYERADYDYEIFDVGRGASQPIARVTELQVAAGLVHLLNVHGLPPLAVSEGFAERGSAAARSDGGSAPGLRAAS